AGTYFVSGPVFCEGQTTLRENAVIKYPNDATAFIEIDGNLTCPVDPTRPAKLTAGDDDSVGESLSGVWGGYSGTVQPGGYANPAVLYPSLANVSIRYAQTAIVVYEGGVSLENCQLADCVTGIDLETALYAYDPVVRINNSLVGGLENFIADNYPSGNAI